MHVLLHITVVHTVSVVTKFFVVICISSARLMKTLEAEQRENDFSNIQYPEKDQ